MTDATTVQQNIARAKACLRREDFAAAMRLLSVAMSQYAEISLVGPARFAMESLIREILDDCNSQPKLREVMTPTGSSTPVQIRYAHGKESALARLFDGLAVRLEQSRLVQEQEKERQRLERRQRLCDKARELLDNGEMHKGLAFIRRVLTEYGDNDPDLYLSMAESLHSADLVMDAAEILSQGIDLFPKTPAFYAASIKMYAEIGKLNEAENIFRRGIRQFGAHPRNLLAMARIYAEAGQRARAAALLYRLLQSHPDCEEAKTLVAQLEFS